MKISNFGYYWLDTWVIANVIQLATQDFCSHFLNRTNLSSIHILKQKQKFNQWFNPNDSVIWANCVLVLCNRLIMMLRMQITNLLKTFSEEGGFSEALTAERLAHRTKQSITNDGPTCPKCGKPMIKRVAKRGLNAGNDTP